MHVLRLLILYIYTVCTGGSDMDLEVGGDCGNIVTGDCIHDPPTTSTCPRRYLYVLQINIKCIYSYSLKYIP